MRGARVALSVVLSGLGLAASSAVAGDDNVRLIWTGTTGLGATGSSTIQVSNQDPETLTLDVVIDADAAGVWGAFLSLHFDADFGDELDNLSVQELSWGNAKATRQLQPFLSPGIRSSQESSSTAQGELYELNSAANFAGGADLGPSDITITFARAVFVTKPGQIASDGDDIVSGKFSPDGTGRADGLFTNDPISITEAVVSFGGAAVDLAPTASLPLPPWSLGVGAVLLVAASAHATRRR